MWGVELKHCSTKCNALSFFAHFTYDAFLSFGSTCWGTWGVGGWGSCGGYEGWGLMGGVFVVGVCALGGVYRGYVGEYVLGWGTWEGLLRDWRWVGYMGRYFEGGGGGGYVEEHFLEFFQKIRKKLRARETGKNWTDRKTEQNLNKNRIRSRLSPTRNYNRSALNSMQSYIGSTLRNDKTVWNLILQ